MIVIARPYTVQPKTPCDLAKLRLLVADRLDDAEVTLLTNHLDECTACRAALDRSALEYQEWNDTKSTIRKGLAGELEWSASGNLDNHESPRHENASLTSWLKPCTDQQSTSGFIGQLDKYLVRRVVGTGGMGVVLEGWDEQLHRPIAIKAMHPHLASIGIARQRFVREARAAAAVVHPNVVPIHSVHADFDPPYLVMPLIAGESLHVRIEREGQLEVDAALRIASQVADGLGAAHAQGLIHRDIKPANILVEHGTERALITDFGVVRALDDATMTTSGAIAGTPEYMSPEQARGDSLDHRSDLFSLGSVLYTMLVGRSPFRSESPLGVLRRITDDTPRPIQQINPRVPDWMVTLVQWMHEKQPNDRADSAHSLAHELRCCLSHWHDPLHHQLPNSISKRMIHAKPSRWIPWLVCGVVSVIVVAILMIPGLRPIPTRSTSNPNSQSLLKTDPEKIPQVTYAPEFSRVDKTIASIELDSRFNNSPIDMELLLIEIQIQLLESSMTMDSVSNDWPTKPY
ncbi:MAG: serine/threonine-protein kinase [Pirellula sp.]